MSIYFLFPFFLRALILFRRIARKLQTTNPAVLARRAEKRAGDAGEGWRLNSNSFGKAPSSVKIRGTAERFTAGRLEEEATCVQSYHLAGTRTYSPGSPSPLLRGYHILRL